MHKTRLVNFLLLLVCLQASAYSDHRGKKTDSLEAVLASSRIDLFAHQGEGTEVNIELPNDK